MYSYIVLTYFDVIQNETSFFRNSIQFAISKATKADFNQLTFVRMSIKWESIIWNRWNVTILLSEEHIKLLCNIYQKAICKLLWNIWKMHFKNNKILWCRFNNFFFPLLLVCNVWHWQNYNFCKFLHRKLDWKLTCHRIDVSQEQVTD